MSRPETGPMQFGDDWTGVFLRGDYAGPMAFMLRQMLYRAKEHSVVDPITLGQLDALVDALAGSNEFSERASLQRMKPFEECVEQYEAKDVG